MKKISSQILIIIGCFLLSSCVQTKEKSSQEMMNEPIEKPGFFHVVYFFINSEATAEQIKQFEDGLIALGKVETLIDYHIGKPAMTPRDVVDNSYDYSIITSFKDKAGHDAYQVDPIHDDFRNAIAGIVDSVRIYDSLVE